MIGVLTVTGAPAAMSADSDDLTDLPGVVSDKYTKTGSEGFAQVIDNSEKTKYLAPASSTWLQFAPTTPAAVDRYTLTSANDAQDRDPKDWTLQGSMDGTTWVTLDSRTDEKFVARYQKRWFSFAASKAYGYYRLNVTANNGAGDTQLSEWELWTPGDGKPTAPSGLKASAVNSTEIDVSWLDNCGDVAPGYSETGFEIQRAAQGGDFARVTVTKPDVTRWTDTTIGNGKYSYRVRALGLADFASDFTAVAEATPAVTGVRDLTDSGGVLSDQYSSTGSEGAAQVIDNSQMSKYLTYRPTTWLQFALPVRTKIDRYTVTSANDFPERDPKDWTLHGSLDGSTWVTLDTRTGEKFPARYQKRWFSFTPSTAYAFYRFNVTANNGTNATQLSEWELWTPGDGIPAAPSGLTAAAVNATEGDLSWNDNSGAPPSIGYPETGFEIQRARQGGDFTRLTVTRPDVTRWTDTSIDSAKYSYRVRALGLTDDLASAFTSAVEMAPAQTGVRDLTDSKGVISDQHSTTGSEGIEMVIDNTEKTKYHTWGRALTWLQFAPAVRGLVDRYTVTSGNDFPERDPKDWTLQGSMDGSTWVTLDTRIGEKFITRFQKRWFAFPASKAYAFYRINVTANNGGNDFQLSEWQLWTQGDGLPPTPSGLTAGAVSSTETDLSWDSNFGAETVSYPASTFEIQRSTATGSFSALATVAGEVTRFTDTATPSGTSYSYRVRAVTAEGKTSAFTPVVAQSPFDGKTRDLTDLPGVLTDQYNVSGGRFDTSQVADNTAYSKYLTYNASTWLRYDLALRSAVTSYTLTSADDVPEQDPKNWTLQGSMDGSTWVTLDTRTNEKFDARFQKRLFSVSNATRYWSYRLNITAVNGAGATHLAEWELLAPTAAIPAPVPEAPSELTAKAVSGDQVRLTWKDNSRWDTSSRIERSSDGSNWTAVRTAMPSDTRATDVSLSSRTTYRYRIRAQNATGGSEYSTAVSVTTPNWPMPEKWQEHWVGLDGLVTRTYEDKHVAVYTDDNEVASQTWINNFSSRLWAYTKQNYGTDFSNPTLGVILHKAGFGGRVGNVFDENSDYRNLVDVGLFNWEESDTAPRDFTAHEMAHVVEAWSGGVEGSPSFGLWGDSKWAEIYQYDVYVGAGFQADADRWYADKMQTRDSFPRDNTAWFKDWFYPIWRDHGKGAVLARYFDVLAKNHIQRNGSYARRVNWGEFVHFWSGATGTNLKAQATNAFGWPTEYETEFRQAQLDYPNVSYAGK